MLCENVGIMNLGVLAAFDTAQGLKDTLMHKNQDALLRQMENLSSADEFSAIERYENSGKKETIAGVDLVDIDSESDIRANIKDTTGTKEAENDNKIDKNHLTARFLARDPDNHSPEYLAKVRKYTKEISIMVKSINDKILEDIKSLDIVYHLNATESGEGTRLTIAVDKFADNSVNNVIWSIVKNDGYITSINTKDPSLEDVFIDVTSKKTVDQANMKNAEL